jgi:hypothetical protein
MMPIQAVGENNLVRSWISQNEKLDLLHDLYKRIPELLLLPDQK